MCHSREGIDAPKDSFNRWLLERRVIDQGKDPLLPSYCFPGRVLEFTVNKQTILRLKALLFD